MTPETYKELLKDLQKREKTLVPAYLATLRADPALTAHLQARFAVAEVGGRFDDFAMLCCRRSAVQFLLRTVYVRVLEDLGALDPPRIRGDWGFAAFREVAPALGVREFFKWTFRDLARDLPALFTPSLDELPLPSEDLCREVWDLWHRMSGDKPVYAWTSDTFDSHFLGNLYQDLDAEVRKRFALLQTPDFVEKYILDHTLTPALEEFDPVKLRADGQTFRIIDPTCGSGHFLGGAFHRLADYWQARGVEDPWEAAQRALESVWGCDINPHAVDIARFRLMLEVRARTGVTQLEKLAKLTFNLHTMDSLIPWERGVSNQVDLFPAMDRLSVYATPRERADNAAFLNRAFHVVVGNPPYIRPRDPQKSQDYRAFWPKSASGKYAMSAPFIERFFVLGRSAGAYIGQITASSFMTRAFGKSVIEVVIPRWEISRIIDTSMAALPNHGMKGGTATFILFGRALACRSASVWAVVSKRGEPSTPKNPAEGLVWKALTSAPASGTYSTAFAELISIERTTLNQYPWSIGTSMENIIKDLLEKGNEPLGRSAEIGFLTKPVIDDIYIPIPSWIGKLQPNLTIPMLEGACLRDWGIDKVDISIFPYAHDTPESPLTLSPSEPAFRYFWPYREMLWRRRSRASKFAPLRTIRGAKFYEFPFYYPQTFRGEFITYAFQTTDNQFVLCKIPALVKQTAPAILLRSDSRRTPLEIIGALNSSTVQFWVSRVFTPKGRVREEWDNWREIDCTKLKLAPLVDRDIQAREALAAALMRAAEERSVCLPKAVFSSPTWKPADLAEVLAAGREKYRHKTHQMVALQEELDWLTYVSYGVIESISLVSPDEVEPLAPGHRPFEIIFARLDDEADEDEKSVWWRRHGHARVTEIPSTYSEATRTRLHERMELIESDPKLQILEQPVYKRHWQIPDFDAETKSAAESYLLDRLENLFAPGGPLAKPTPYRLEQIVDAWIRDPRTVAVARVWKGGDVDLSLAAEQLLRAHGLPDNPRRIFTAEGLRILAAWKTTWDLQDLEDQGKPLIDPDTGRHLDSIEPPPKFESDHFQSDAFSIRGTYNVSRERFIIFADLSPPRYGWNGWRDTDRARAQVDAYGLAESDPDNRLPPPTVADPRRCGPTLGLWESLADVRRWDEESTHAELLALAQEVCGQKSCPCDVVDAWQTQQQQQARSKRSGRKASLPVVVPKPAPAPAPPAEPDTIAVTIEDRGFVFRLIEPFGEGGATLGDLTKSWGRELGFLARVLDDLIASGDLKTRGRGKKKIYIAASTSRTPET